MNRCRCRHIKALHKAGVCMVQQCGCVEYRSGLTALQDALQAQETISEDGR